MTEQTVQQWKDKLSKGIDTYELQLLSLETFLLSVGYKIVSNDFDITIHIRKLAHAQEDYPEFISLQAAVQLYNGDSSPFRKGIIKVTLANRCSRILDRVYLRRERGIWYLSQNWIRFNVQEVGLTDVT